MGRGPGLFCPMISLSVSANPLCRCLKCGLREVTTDNIETSLCFDSLKYGGLLEMAAMIITLNSPIRGDMRAPESLRRTTTQAQRGRDHACKSHRQDAGHELTLGQASSSSSGSTAMLICVGQGWVPARSLDQEAGNTGAGREEEKKRNATVRAGL